MEHTDIDTHILTNFPIMHTQSLCGTTPMYDKNYDLYSNSVARWFVFTSAHCCYNKLKYIKNKNVVVVIHTQHKFIWRWTMFFVAYIDENQVIDKNLFLCLW